MRLSSPNEQESCHEQGAEGKREGIAEVISTATMWYHCSRPPRHIATYSYFVTLLLLIASITLLLFLSSDPSVAFESASGLVRNLLLSLAAGSLASSPPSS